MNRIVAIIAMWGMLISGQFTVPSASRPQVSGGGGYTDTFPGTFLSGNWTCYTTTGWGLPSVGSNSVFNSQTQAVKSLCAYTGGTFGANQQSQAVVGTGASLPAQQGICIHVDPTNGNGYCWQGFAGAGPQKVTAGSGTTMGGFCGTTFIAGDTINISNVGSTISVIKNGSSACSNVTDSTYTGGYSGFLFSYANLFSAQEKFTNWAGQ